MTKEEILEPLYKLYDLSERSKARFNGAVNKIAKQQAIEFFKWYCNRMNGFVEYFTRIKPIVTSNEIEERIKEHEGSTFEELYSQFVENQSKETNNG